MTYCGCSHDASRHLAGGGACVVTLPPVPLEEVPAWRCPCRRFVASRVTSWAARRGRPKTRQSAEEAAAALAAVQSCTVHASGLGEHSRGVLEAAYEATAWQPLPRGA